MTQKEANRLIDALGQLAFDGTRSEWKVDLNILRAALASSTTTRTRSAIDLWHGHTLAATLLDEAAKIAERETDQNRARLRLLRLARRAMIFDTRLAPEATVDFVVTPVVDRRGVARIKIVGPRNADARFLVAYAFWKAAAVVPPKKWRAFLARSCAACDATFRDLRTHMRHGPMTRCAACREKDRRTK